MIAKQIIFFGNILILSCDKKCHKAWGINNRRRRELSEDEDDFEWFSDDELGDAPIDPGTYEGGHSKPYHASDLLNKWCARECERSVMAKPCENFELKDFSKRIKNMGV